MSIDMIEGYFRRSITNEIEDKAKEIVAVNIDEFDEENNEPASIGRRVAEGLSGRAIASDSLFVDIKQLNLVSRPSFTAALIRHPLNESLRLNMKSDELRQGLARLWKHTITLSLVTVVLPNTYRLLKGNAMPVRTPALLGHSSSTPVTAYIMNPGIDLPIHSGIGDFYDYKPLARIFQSLISYIYMVKIGVSLWILIYYYRKDSVEQTHPFSICSKQMGNFLEPRFQKPSSKRVDQCNSQVKVTFAGTTRSNE
ncbi:hypothetical protein KAFR_0B03240 [Kazachstania africana CBS 2517]|uniref:Uncharacterized protein n=1 Tax=Kazachstania africana (strain ATCC 22294 / BCRC 22015 / CBS 2517 / CECT 1963 / NBRC 1671 / NRRL Y-8276) TaxID=1071382 RepID=H2AQH0_KAZAF|nr:hypothetical protein KAFR_0B03240 [Kazachstania africana CBS 2517]CCF56620.1 hypothetical protein KAFR_0B03240 [Kazachstania africana CBS 2517]